MSYSDSWDYYLHRITTSDFNYEQKKHLAKAVNTMRRHLSEDWPSKSKDTHHELLWLLRSISGSISDNLLVLWGDCMSAIEDIDGFASMLSKIADPVTFHSSIAELEVAGRLAMHGCRLKLEPSIKGKKPDLFCENEDSTFYIEVKTLLTADETAKATRTTGGILMACKPILPSGIIIKPLSKPHLNEITSLLEQKIAYAISNKTDIEVNVRS